MIRHIVLFSFKSDIDIEKIIKADESFKNLSQLIPEILSFESGLNISPEGLNKGFTHAYQLSFDSEDTRDLYLNHNDHLAFSKSVQNVIVDVLVFDYLI